MPPAAFDTTERTVSIDFDGWAAALPEAAVLAQDAVEAALVLACPGLGPAGLAIVLTGDAAIRDLNRTWRGKDAPTNVLSFPATETEAGEMPVSPFEGVPLELGDIVIACETCIREAAEQGKPLAHHIQHLAIHGLLHLLGYDHEAEDEAERMEQLEIRVLAGLGIPDPYEIERRAGASYG